MSSQVQTQESESTTTESTVQQMLTAMANMAAQQAQQTREMHRNLKKLKQLKQTKNKNVLLKVLNHVRTVKQKPVGVTKEMEKFLTSHGVKIKTKLVTPSSNDESSFCLH